MATRSRKDPLRGWRRFVQSLSGALEMPGDVMLDLPRATLIGQGQVVIENHKGVAHFTSRSVRITTRNGHMLVEGGRLKISNIYKEQVVVEGRIERIEWLTAGRSAISGNETGMRR